MDDIKEFIVNVVVNILRIIIKKELENYICFKYVFFFIIFKLWLVLIF